MRSDNIEDIYELSPLQQGLLFHVLASPNSGVYCDQYNISLKGNLNRQAFENAWKQAIARHSILRTSFYWEKLEKPLQVVHRQVRLPLEQLDWRSLSSTQQRAQLQTLLDSEQSRGFELSQAPLMRLILIQLTEDSYQFIWTNYHLILDGWSRSLLVKEFLDIYQALCNNEPLKLSPPIPYKDYITWLQQQNRKQAEVFWQQLLTGIQAPTPLVIKKAVSSLSGEENCQELKLTLSAELTAQLQSIVSSYQITLNTLIQGVWAILLNRYSGEEDVIFGAVSSGRPPALTGSETAIGLFINTLPIRVHLEAEELLSDWLKKLQSLQGELREYEYCRLVDIQGWSEIPRGLPLFESLVIFENYPTNASRQEITDLEIGDVAIINTTNYPLTLMVAPSSELALTVLYDRRYFDAEIINRLLGHMSVILEGIAAQPDGRLKDISILTEHEKHQLLIDWNNTHGNYPQTEGIHQLFERQVEKTPDAVAVVFEEEELTYQELNQRANQLAYYLRELGVDTNALVGICVERSLEMLVGLLGILKAGGAYIPLDPAYPQERLAFMLEDSQVSVLLTQQHLLEVLPKFAATTLVSLDGDREKIARQNKNNLARQVQSDNLAYIIYTSGSTGKPKGVQIPHRAVVNFLSSMRRTPGLTETDILLSVTTLSFDIAALELFLPLAVGARVVVVSREVASDGVRLLAKLTESGATIMQATPSTWRLLLAAGWEGNKGLKILCGGEALPQTLADELRSRCEVLWNMYGPTETTIWSTVCRVEEQVTIGRPIANTQVYILDPYQHPVPIGVPGELYIGGDGVSLGYLNQPELTAEKFVPNSFNGDGYLYKTGDLVRYLADGNIEYIGRCDRQVKVRGFRIELGEIETRLSKHPNVREAVVIGTVKNPEEKRLVAYIIPDGEVPTSSKLRDWLQQILPNYMVPSAFVTLEKMPLLPNGKVNRRALPAPDSKRPELDEEFVAPRTPQEQVLARVWSHVLNVKQVGIYDNFFALGGDSIRSIQVRALTLKEGFNVSIQQLFHYQTIYELAQRLTDANTTTEYQSVKPFALIPESDRLSLPQDIEDAYPLVQLQLGMLFQSKFNADTKLYHNISSFHLRAVWHLEHLQTSIQLLAKRHPILRTSFNLSEFSKPLQLVHKRVLIPVQVEDLRQLNEREREEAIATWFEAEKSRKIDWTNAPLLRFQIHRRSEETFQFSLTFHHAILDGWSLATLLGELFEQYFSLVKDGKILSLPEPAIAFRDFVALQQTALKSETSCQFWLQKLKGATKTILPRWRDRRSQIPENQIVEVPIASEISEQLKTLAKSAAVPIKSVLLVAHLKVLSLLSNQTDIITGLSSNGRPEQTDGDKVLGLFLNTLPFRQQLSGGTWLDLVQQTFKLEQDLLSHRWYPMTQIQKDLGGLNLFETSFNFTHFHRYQPLQQSRDVELLNVKGLAIKDLVLLAQFSLNPISSQIALFLECNPDELDESQANDIGNYYAKILVAMALESKEKHDLFGADLVANTRQIQERQEQALAQEKRKRLQKNKRKAIRGS